VGMSSALSIENGSWQNVFRQFPQTERYWLWEPLLNPASHPMGANDDCVVLRSDAAIGDVVEMSGAVWVKRDTLLQSSPVSQISLGYSEGLATPVRPLLFAVYGYAPILEYTGVSQSLSSVEEWDKYRLKFVCQYSSYESFVSDGVYLCLVSPASLFTTPSQQVNFSRPKIRVCRAPRPSVVMAGDSLYQREVKVYSVYQTSSVKQIGTVPVREREVMVSGRAVVGDDREAVFGVLFGSSDPRGLNGESQFWADVRQVYVDTPYGRVYFVQNDVLPTQRQVVNFDRQVYDYNGGVPKSWRIAPKKNGYAYVGFPKLAYNTVSNPAQRSAQGILLYWRDFSVFPSGFSGVVPCEVVVESIVGEVRRSFNVRVVGRTVKYRYSDYASYGTIEFVGGVGSEMYEANELQSFFDGIYVLDGSVVEEYGYGSYVGAGERVIFPNVLRMELRVDGEDVFDKVVNIIGGVRYSETLHSQHPLNCYTTPAALPHSSQSHH
jgi:hypothetical protein